MLETHRVICLGLEMVLGLLRQAKLRRLCQPATNAKGGVRDSDESTLWQAYRPACDAGLPCHLWIEDGEVTVLASALPTKLIRILRGLKTDSETRRRFSGVVLSVSMK
jgi:hypothetical protein